MKYIFIVLSFFTLTMPLMAQEQMRYIVNLPPLSIYHSNLTIMRNSAIPNNFIPGDINTFEGLSSDDLFNILNGSTGALILGANPDKTIKIYKTNNSDSNTINITQMFADGSLIFAEKSECSGGVCQSQQFNEITINSITNTNENDIEEEQNTYMTNATVNSVTLENGTPYQIDNIYVRGFTNIMDTNFLPQCDETIYWKQIRLQGSNECRAFLVCGGGNAPDDTPDCAEPEINN